MDHAKKFLLLALYDEYALVLRILAALLLNAGYETEIVMFKNFSLSVKTPPTEMDFSLFQNIIEKLSRMGFLWFYLFNWPDPFLCKNLANYLSVKSQKYQ